jgi:hypothetical protein
MRLPKGIDFSKSLVGVKHSVTRKPQHQIKGGQTMEKRLFFILTVLAVGLGMVMANAGNTLAGEAEIVKIWAKDGAMHAEPANLNVKKNTVVVWMNGLVGKEIKIVFKEGKTCMDVTVNPDMKEPNFFMDAKGCYVTSFVPYTNTTSLQFPEAGNFDYVILTSDGTMSAKGKIFVKP